MLKSELVKVGVGVIIFKDNKVLMGKRLSKHGYKTWSFPGGHLEFFEEIFDCARREVLEETGITIKNLRQGRFVNALHKEENQHYVTLFVIADYDDGIVKIEEPDKCEKWDWFSLDNLPEPLFLPIEILVKEGGILKGEKYE